VKRLGQEFEVVATAFGVFQYLRSVSLAGEEQDMTVPKLLTNRDRQFDTIHAGHDHVTEDQIRNLSPAYFKG
jgi:hypothetical protein